MRKYRLLAVCSFIAASYLLAVVYSPAYLTAEIRPEPVTAVLPPPENINAAPTDQIILRYSEANNGRAAPAGAPRMQVLSLAAGVTLAYVREMSGDAHVLRLPGHLPLPEVEAIANRIAGLPEVAFAEPDRIMLPTFTPDDPSFGGQWHYFEANGINLPEAWDFTTGASGVHIAVLDSGITEHPDLNGRWVGGYDFVTNIVSANDGNGRDDDPRDPGDWIEGNECPGFLPRPSRWHGTHVAGIIGAAGNNGLGTAGINWASPIVPVRVLGKCGGYISDIADGMRWAAGLPVSGAPVNDYPARLLNMSLGGPGVCSPTYQSAIDDVNTIGGIIVVSAGNGGSNLNTNSFQPANCHGVIVVTATDRGGDKAIYSNYGAIVHLSAPGGETAPDLQNGVLSTVDSGFTGPVDGVYGYRQGTSMAVPHVTGVLSLMLSLRPSLTWEQGLQILQETAQSFPSGSSCHTAVCGSGIVDAGAALRMLEDTAVSTATYTSTPSPTATIDITQTPTPSSVPSQTATPSPTVTSSGTPDPTASSTPTSSATPTLAYTQTATPAPTITSSGTPGSTASSTPTSSATPTLAYTQTATPSSTAVKTDDDTPVPVSAVNFIYLPIVTSE